MSQLKVIKDGTELLVSFNFSLKTPKWKRSSCACSPSSAKHAVQFQGKGSQGLHPSYRWHAISSIFANLADDNNLTYKIIITSFVEYKIHKLSFPLTWDWFCSLWFLFLKWRHFFGRGVFLKMLNFVVTLSTFMTQFINGNRTDA